MKDFKKMPKMACGGKIKKYSGEDGSYVTKEGREIPGLGRVKPVPMPGKPANPEGREIAGIGKVKPVQMPGRPVDPEGREIPGIGKVKPVPMPPLGSSEPLKKGGKVKRGMKK